MTKVKICGLSEIDEALASAKMGADYIGVVFTTSRRQVSLEKAIQIVSSIRTLKPCPAIVGIFANSTALEVNSISKLCRLDMVQLSGDESFEYCDELDIPVIKAFHISGESSSQEILQKIQKGNRLRSDIKLKFLLDTRDQDYFGGTGRAFNWQIAKEISRLYPVIIAGGLTPDNVGHLIEEVEPWGVDVSSGVETEGKKDILKIRNFIQTVKSYNGSK